jgi:probable HAF family extracellular repeat protein
MRTVSVFGQIVLSLLVGALASLAALVSASYGADAAYKFTVVDIPLHFTFLGQQRDDIVRLTDINNKGQLIGNDFAGDGFFIDKKHRATEIRCPSDVSDNNSTTVSAINNAGQVVGSCSDGGFVRDRNGNIAIINFPGAVNTVAYGINDLGEVVGQYGNSPFTEPTGIARFHGFVWRNGVYTTIDAPFSDAVHTALLGINNAGQIIGTYLHHRPGSSDINDYDSEVAFLYDSGNFTPLEFPGAQISFCCGAQTFPMDINNLGQVVGSSYDSDGKPQFFLYDDGKYFVITGVPENVIDPIDNSIIHGSSAFGINDKSEIAGTYVERVPCESCGIHGEPGYKLTVHSFVATPKKVRKKHEPVN